MLRAFDLWGNPLYFRNAVGPVTGVAKPVDANWTHMERERQMNRRFHMKELCLAGAIACLAAGMARAQIGISVDVGNLIPATDVLGRHLPGSWGFSNEASRIEIREVGTGIVKPPAAESEIEAANPLVRTTYLGNNVIGSNPGKFSEPFADRGVLAGKSYYARVYDAPEVSGAMYFSDSRPFHDVPATEWGIVHAIEVVFEPVSLVSGEDDTDTDGDGLPDWMEADLGTSPTRQDTDGDGYGDRFEVIHEDYLHRNDLDPNEIRLDPPEVAGEHAAAWWAIPNVAYRLEYTDAMTDPEAFVEIWSGTAATTNLAVGVEDWVTNSPTGFFRWAIP